MAALLPVVVAAAVVFMHRRLSAWLCGKDWVGKGQEGRKKGRNWEEWHTRRIDSKVILYVIACKMYNLSW